LVEGDRLRAEVPRAERLTRFNFDAPPIAAVMDRWRPEKHTFHLLVSEMTLSLEDATMLGGLSCAGEATSFFDRLQPYVAEWASAVHEQNVVTEHHLHAAATWVAYLQRYLPRTRTRVTYVPATPPPPPVPDTTGSCRTRPTRCVETKPPTQR
jgi:hypothetical protein